SGLVGCISIRQGIGLLGHAASRGGSYGHAARRTNQRPGADPMTPLRFICVVSAFLAAVQTANAQCCGGRCSRGQCYSQGACGNSGCIPSSCQNPQAYRQMQAKVNAPTLYVFTAPERCAPCRKMEPAV